MFAKVCVLLLAIGVSQAAQQMVMPEAHLMKFMMRSRDLSQGNPARTLSCFDTYLPQLNLASEDFQKAYSACLDAAEASRLGIDDSTKEERTEIDASATSACQALDTCSQATDSISYFECYTAAGNDNTKVMYTISANSAELLAQVREDYRLIDINQYACTNKSERAYVENSAAIYDNFDRCLAGLEPLVPSTTAPTTAEPSTSEPSTAGPSTAEPTTADPSTSEPSTAGPSTAEPSTAEPSTAEPSTAEPSTAEPSTAEPSTPGSTTDENPPEEDLSRLAAEENKLKEMMSNMQKWFKGH